MTPIGIIIVSYNTCALLRDCLASLRGCVLPLHTVVVDNGSRDGSVAMVRADFSDVLLIESGSNLGFAAANNLGIATLFNDTQNSTLKTQTSKLDHVLLLNPDTVVHAGAIETLVAFLVAHPREQPYRD